MEFDTSYNNTEANHQEKSELKMLVEIIKLTLKIIWRITYHTIKIAYKGAKWFIRTTYTLSKRAIEWWNDNDTQIKLRLLRIKSKSAIKTLSGWTKTIAKALWKFLVWTTRLFFKAITNLKYTLKVISSGISKGIKATIRWSKKQYKKNKYKNAKRKVRYKKFRKTPGFKGLLTDINNHLKELLNKYMDEE